jgi:cytoskeletal protein RodZ
MSFFGKIKSAIFGKAEAVPSAAPPAASQPNSSSSTRPASSGTAQSPAAAATPAASAPPSSTKPADGAATGQQAQNTSAPAPARSTSTAGSQAQVDVAAILNDLASKRKEKLDWRKSIVDLLKLLDLDSSLSARKELAQEWKYSGDMNGSASMNMWLHKQVMRKLAENGGKVPDDLKD